MIPQRSRRVAEVSYKSAHSSPSRSCSSPCSCSSLRSPLYIRGTFGAPAVGPDMGRLAAKGAGGCAILVQKVGKDGLPGPVLGAALVAMAVKAAAEMGVWMVNVHCSGGLRMMAACREVLDQRSGPKPLLIGVTVLTSLNEADLAALGVTEKVVLWRRRLPWRDLGSRWC
jgi:hypothetical protein